MIPQLNYLIDRKIAIAKGPKLFNKTGRNAVVSGSHKLIARKIVSELLHPVDVRSVDPVISHFDEVVLGQARKPVRAIGRNKIGSNSVISHFDKSVS
jgi:hypothetical protein